MDKTGIYKIFCRVNNKAYIGSSVNVKRRLQQHLYALKSNRHINEHLQNAWNQYGENEFEFLLLEEVNSDGLLVREQFWIDKLNASQRSSGFNKAETARPTESSLFKRSKAYIITHPNGVEEEIINLEKWQRDNGIPHDALRKVALGTQNHYKQYLCRFAYQTQEEWKSTLVRNEKSGATPIRNYKILCPDGKIIETNRLNEFCNIYNLNKACMNEVFHKKNGRKQHKGYSFIEEALSEQ